MTAEKDPLRWVGAGLLCAGLVAVRFVTVRWPVIPRTALVVGAGSAALMWRTPFITRRFGGRLYGRGRTGVTRLTMVALGLAVAGFWHGSPWSLLWLVGLVLWCTTVIGRGGGAKALRERFRMAHDTVSAGRDTEQAARALHDADKGLELFRAKLADVSPSAKVSKPTATPNGGISLMVNSDVPLKESGLVWMAARAYGYPTGDILVSDLSLEGRAGTYKIVVGAPRPPALFAKPVGPRPGDWPPRMVPIGEYGDGRPAYIPRQHGVIAGMTGSGKTWAAENLVWCKLQDHYSAVIIDPKRLMGSKYRKVLGVTVAVTKGEMLDALRMLEREMDRRYADMEARGVEDWDRHRIVCLVDETADLVGTVPESSDILVRLYQMARAAGIEMWCCTQRPDAKSIPPLVKANAGIILGLRVANPIAERVVLGEDSKWGIGADDAAANLAAGRGVLVCPGAPTDWVQVYPTPGIKGLPTMDALPRLISPSHDHNCAPSAGEMGETDSEMRREMRRDETGEQMAERRRETRLLDALHDAGPKWLKGSDVADLAGVPRSTAYRMLADMATSGVIAKDAKGAYMHAEWASLEADIDWRGDAA